MSDAQFHEEDAESRSLAGKRRGLGVRIGMGLLNSSGRFGARYLDLSPEQLLDKATSAAKTNDLGPEASEIREGLDRLCADLNDHAQLENVGRALAQTSIVEALAAKIRLNAEFGRMHSSSANPQLDAPIIIVGLPRTGTTRLYQLLAQHPKLRAPQAWELARPVAGETGRVQAMRETKRQIDGFYAMAPGLRAAHHGRADGAEEDFSILRWQLRSTYFSVFFHVPSYLEWVLDGIETRGCDFHRQVLAYWSGGARADSNRWLLKSPEHTWRLRALAEVYPKAVFVHCHRNPMQVCASEAQLVALCHRVSCENVDPQRLQGALASLFSRMVESAENQRDILAADAGKRSLASGCSFVDVHFDELLQDPIACVRRICTAADLELTPSVASSLQSHAEQNPRHAYGVHAYKPMSWQALDEQSRARFEFYASRHGLESS